jgi:thiol-disulfide isomerase/thioredoxin
MIKKTLLTVASLAVVVIAVGGVLYFRNTTPIVPVISAADAANPGKPYVVKLHAQWCPICMLTKGVWSQVETAYAGRANFVVFDFTNDATTSASKAEADRLGLGKFFDENVGATGAISVVDGRSKQEMASVQGVHGFDQYRAAIDEGLRAATNQP